MKNIINIAKREAGKNGFLVATVVKEMLHYDILDALQTSNAAKDIVFQGGTALRLIYQSSRYSEDLDFATLRPITQKTMEAFKKVFVDTVKKKYGLEAEVVDPKKSDYEGRVSVVKWAAKVTISGIPGNEKQKQVINIEIASVPSLEYEVKMVASRYNEVSQDIFVQVETLREIMADKIVAMAGRKHFKARDVWDMAWLKDKNIIAPAEFVRQKIEHYGIANFNERLQEKLEFMETPEAKKLFLDEMRRFLDHRTLQAFEMYASMTADIFRKVIGECGAYREPE